MRLNGPRKPRRETAGRLVIGSLSAATVSFLSTVLPRFREEHPLVEITLLQMNNREQVDAVPQGIHLGTSNGCVDFANDSADLNQILLP
jgi:DNA-binding transcriptional LysR family regulator